METNTRALPDAIEPDYWNVVFHPSETRLARIVLGRFQHVSAFTYIPGFRAWLLYDVQWSGMRLMLLAHHEMLAPIMRTCTLVKFDRDFKRLGMFSRFGFYCVPAVKQLLGLSCVAATPDALYRHLIQHGGSLLHEPKRTPAAAARSDAGDRASASAS